MDYLLWMSWRWRLLDDRKMQLEPLLFADAEGDMTGNNVINKWVAAEQWAIVDKLPRHAMSQIPDLLCQLDC